MPTVQEVFSAESPQEFIDDVELCGYKIKYKSGYAIVKETETSIASIVPPVKGLIFNAVTGDIVAPGVVSHELKEPAEQPIGFSPILDGVLVRIYRAHSNLVSWSTNGMINPTNGRWADGKTFGEIFEDVYRQFDHTMIQSDWCYYAVMEHVEFPGITQKTQSRLVLIGIKDKYGRTVVPMSELSNYGFEHVVPYTDRPPTQDERAFLLEVPTRDGPLEDKHIGLRLYYSNREPVHLVSLRAQDASMILPNYPHIWQHWIQCMRVGGLPLVNAYIAYFPWRRMMFNQFTTAFMRTTYNLDDLSNDELKAVITAPPVPAPGPIPVDSEKVKETEDAKDLTVATIPSDVVIPVPVAVPVPVEPEAKPAAYGSNCVIS
jgi:hypothetical protein